MRYPFRKSVDGKVLDLRVARSEVGLDARESGLVDLESIGVVTDSRQSDGHGGEGFCSELGSADKWGVCFVHVRLQQCNHVHVFLKKRGLERNIKREFTNCSV